MKPIAGQSSIEEIRGRTWYRTITCPDGTSTPGILDMRGIARLVPWPSHATVSGHSKWSAAVQPLFLSNLCELLDLKPNVVDPLLLKACSWAN